MYPSLYKNAVVICPKGTFSDAFISKSTGDGCVFLTFEEAERILRESKEKDPYPFHGRFLVYVGYPAEMGPRIAEAISSLPNVGSSWDEIPPAEDRG